MKIKIAVATVITTFLFCRPAAAEDTNAALLKLVASSMDECKAKADDQAQIDCFNAVSNVLSAAVSKLELEQKQPETFVPGDFKVVDSADLYVSPRKYEGKPIEWKNVQCLYADVGEYRCVTGTQGPAVIVFAGKVTPDSEQKILEDDCSSIKQTFTRRCRRTLHMVYGDYTEDDVGGLNNKRIVLKASSVEVYRGK